MSHKYSNWKAYGSLHFRTKSFFLCNKPKPMNNGFPLVALLTFCVRAVGLGPAANLGKSRWTTNVLKTNRGNHTRSPCRENKKSGRTPCICRRIGPRESRVQRSNISKRSVRRYMKGSWSREKDAFRIDDLL